MSYGYGAAVHGAAANGREGMRLGQLPEAVTDSVTVAIDSKCDAMTETRVWSFSCPRSLPRTLSWRGAVSGAAICAPVR